MDSYRILAINPGSTSTKIAVYLNSKLLFLKKIEHSSSEILSFEKISDQYEFRKEIILKELIAGEIDINNLNAVIGRGGLVKPIESGIYEVNDALKNDLIVGVLGEHASNLGGLIADDIAKSIPNAKAYIADPVVVDELCDVARISGHPLFNRISIFHALNQKTIARTYAKSVCLKYEDLNLIIAHLGGGISIGAHLNGKVIDVNQALNGNGPFSPERSGSLPVGELAKICFSGKYLYKEVKRMITGRGGFVAYLGTNNAREVEQRAKSGDDYAKLIQDAMSFQIAKEIGAMSVVLKGKVDAILITGGLAYNEDIIEYIKERISFIAPVIVYPGEDEMQALAMNGLMVLKGELEPKVYI